jgi:hypothetical protein
MTRNLHIILYYLNRKSISLFGHTLTDAAPMLIVAVFVGVILAVGHS